jgi:integrase
MFRKRVDGKPVCKYFDNTHDGLKQADIFVTVFLADIKLNKHSHPDELKSMAFSWAAEQFYTHHFLNNPNREFRAKKEARQNLNRMIAFFGDKPYEKITYLEIQDYLAQLPSLQTQNRHLSYLRSLYARISDWNKMGNILPCTVKLAEKDPALFISKPSEHMFRRHRVMSPKEWEAIKLHAPEWLQAFASIAVVSQLRHKDIRILISNPIQSAGDSLVGIQAKTGLPYSLPQLAVLRQSLEVLKAHGRLSYWKVVRAWQRTCTKANVEDLTVRDLRRTGAQAGRDAGATLDTSQAILGHAQVSTTQLYIGSPESEKREVMEKVAAKFGMIAQKVV